MTIQFLTHHDLNTAVQDQISALFKQLNANISQLSSKEVLDDTDKTMFACCREEDLIIGIALMVDYKVISGHKGIVEDVVVDNKHRGKGIGRKLMEKLLEEGRNRNLDEIILFTGHHRLPAIRLYKRLGFRKKESGMYTLKLL